MREKEILYILQFLLPKFNINMKSIVLFLSIIFLQTFTLIAGNEKSFKQKQCFFDAKTELESMLMEKTPLDYERAVFITENAYWNNAITYAAYKEYIDFHTERIRNIIENNRSSMPEIKWNILYNQAQQQERYKQLLSNWANYKYLTDTCLFVDSSLFYYHLPYNYSSDDPFGTNNWKNTQTINLLTNKKGNCYALAALYKIFAQRLNTDANLGLAPGHIFINHNDINDNNYNIELASQSFPGAGSIMTLTYTPTDAVRSGIAMRTLDLKQSVALCLVYLAKGYEHKFNTKTDNFILQCAATTLQYDSLNLNAMLLKAEVLEKEIIEKNKSVAQLQKDYQFNEYEKLIADLYVKGYREMPLEMKNIIINKLQKDSSGLILTDHTPKGFRTINPKDDRYATLSWGLYDEIHEAKLNERYNNTLYNTRTEKITKFVASDILYNKYQIDAAAFAWQIDPLASKYPMMSPYMAFADNPIYYIDPNGAENWPALQYAKNNLIGIPVGHNGDSWYYGTWDNPQRTKFKENPNLLVCYETVWQAYIGSARESASKETKDYLRTGFSLNSFDSFVGRDAAKKWFKNSDDKRQFITDIKKGEEGDIVFVSGHAMMLSAPPLVKQRNDDNGKIIETVTLKVITTSSSAGAVVEDEVNYNKDTNGNWSGDYGNFEGYGQLNIEELKKNKDEGSKTE